MAGLGETVADLARYRRWVGAGPRVRTGASSSLPALTVTSSFGANPGDLRMLSYAPRDLARGAPMVVVLHGCTQSAQAYAEGAGWMELADRLGLLLLCPEQKSANNFNLCFNWFQPEDTTRGSGEAASIRQMIQHLGAEHGVDSGKVFVTGLSAGGAMASVMLAAYPEVFAGGAIIAGLAYGAAATVQEAFGAMFHGKSRTPQSWGAMVRNASPHPRRWPRVAIWQGEADTTVRPSNAAEIAKQWTDVWGLSSGPDRTVKAGGVDRSVWTAPDGADAVQLNLVLGLGHGAPIAAGGDDGCGRPGPYVLEAAISSSLEALRFWGVETAVQTKAPPHTHKTPPSGTQADARPDAQSSAQARKPRPVYPILTPAKLASGVEQAIAKALTAAGLVK
jgi:feruloyl esterase